MERLVKAPEEMQAFVGEFISGVLPRPDAATVLALSGELGAGKTTFAQGAARALGVEEPATSPTFVLQKAYPLSGQKFSHLIHIDAYRLKRAEELEALGWGTLVRDPGNLILLEWPEHVERLVPEGALRIRLEHIDEHTRSISYGKK